MKNIWALFRNDLKRVKSNMVTMIIVAGLVLLPSIFVWYNILACWDVFDNTDHLKVAVANTDEGYQSDLVPLKLHLGEQVEANLRENDQMDWVFTTEEDAIRGVESGEYYAAVVIPPSFSKDMMTFYSEDVEHAKILYYSNEKKNVVAPKLTDQGADKVSAQVNTVFTATLSEIALNIASQLDTYAQESDATGRLGDLADHMTDLGSQMRQGAKAMTSYVALIDASQGLIESSAALIGEAQSSADEVGDSVSAAGDSISTISDAVSQSSEALDTALSDTAASYDGVSSAVDDAFSSSSTAAGTMVSSLRSQASSVEAQVEQMKKLRDQIAALGNGSGVSEADKKVIQALVDRMDGSIAAQEKLAASLRMAADDVESGNKSTQEAHEEVKGVVADARSNVKDLSSDFTNDIKPQLDSLLEITATMAGDLLASAQKLSSVGSQLQGSADSLSERLEGAKGKLTSAASDLEASAKKFDSLAASIDAALSGGDIDALREVLSSDTESLAAAIAAPVKLDRQAIFPADNFGSQMAPLYATLGLWIGSLLLVVAIRVQVSHSQRDELGDWKLYQLFLGRFGIFSLASFVQTTIMALGNMFFLGVQVSDPLLYLLCFWAAGQVFVFICYTLVVSFANLGKAIAVFLLIIQVTSGGGSFPLPILPEFFQVLSPFLPAAHVINAMRAAMMGVYQGDFWIELGELLLFVVPFLLLGLALRKPLMRLLKWYVDRVEESKLVC